MPPLQTFLSYLKERILVFDGAMGTNLQAQNLSKENFGGFVGCNEALNLFSPHSVRKVHVDFLKAGCRAIETNTFGANRIVLSEYKLENKVEAINKAAVKIAREAIEEAGIKETCFVAASIGPGSKLPSLGHITFEELKKSYIEQLQSLYEAGADIFVIETCQDLLQVKAALAAAFAIFKREGARLPVMVSVTLEPSGTTLVGSDIETVQAVLEPFDIVDAIGINCASGPLEMVRHVKALAQLTKKAVSVMPNAGLPQRLGDKFIYNLSPAEFADFHCKFVEEYGVNIVGGCCGTTPQHLTALVSAMASKKPRQRRHESMPAVAGLYNAVSLRQSPPPCLVGERTNANGSRRFRDLLLAEDWEGMTALGKEQARGGAHLLDLSVAYVGRNELTDMCELVPRFARQVRLPLVIDSTDPKVIKAALQRHGGRCVINSVNLEDGGKKLGEIANLAKEYGAAIICLAIDEAGMARTCERKLNVINRLYEILTEIYELHDEDLIFDPLTFTVGSGDIELRKSALETLDAVEALSKRFPNSHTILGISNVSYGLDVAAREVLNSVFLAEAVARGLNIAIVNPAGIIPPFKISKHEYELARNVLYDASGDGSDLTSFMQLFTKNPSSKRKSAVLNENVLTAAEILHSKVLDGDSSNLNSVLNALLKQVEADKIINEHLIPAMRRVGELFGRGEMQLPFVLQSAEVVRAAVNSLAPKLSEKTKTRGKAVVLATVVGDVHDIGKNLVKIVLENNGYNVVDLGIKVDIDTMIRAAQEKGAEVIGMSGLLVRSTQIMKENLEELNRRGFYPAVILGGAALTRSFVEEELRSLYKGEVYYAADAFEGLSVLDAITGRVIKTKNTSIETTMQASENTLKESKNEASLKTNRHRSVLESPIAWLPPFWGNKTMEFKLNELINNIDERVLFQSRWGYEKGNRSFGQYAASIENEAKPALKKLVSSFGKDKKIMARGVYGYYRCRAFGDKLRLYSETNEVLAEFEFPRQKHGLKLCVSDFFSASRNDLIILWAVTLGSNIAARESELLKDGKYRDYLHLHGFGSELAEAAAAETVQRALVELAGSAVLPKATRFSFGFPACPDLTSQKTLLNLLDAEKIGISLTETYQMTPELSVSGFVTLHPEARYFQI